MICNGYSYSFSTVVHYAIFPLAAVSFFNGLSFSVIGDFILRISTFNSYICKQVLSASEVYQNPANSLNPFNVFDYLSIYHPEEHTAVMELLAAIEKSEQIIDARFFHSVQFFKILYTCRW